MSSQWILLLKDQKPLEAEIIKGYLEQHDISVHLEDKEINTLMPHLEVAFEGVKIYVHQNHFEKAKDLLKKLPKT